MKIISTSKIQIPCKMEEPIADPKCEPTSAEIVAGNEDLATEIFIHLSATSLAPCLWVSKLWLSFISNQTFVSRHNLRYPPSLSGLFLIPRQTILRSKVRFLSINLRKFCNLRFVDILNSKGFQILHSCNGLLLCQLGLSHYVCNPSTCQLRVLPRCSYTEEEYTLHLAFDPLTAPNYKVVCMQKADSQPSLYQIAIYSSETRLWSVSQESVYAPNELDYKDGVFCNGALHWLTSKSSGAYLDLETGVIREMPQPPRLEEEAQYKFEYFGKSQGYLLYIISHPHSYHYELYQMKENYTGWDLMFQVNLNNLIAKYSAMNRNFGRHSYLFSELECDVLGVNYARTKEDMELVLSVPGEIIFFNLEKRNFSVVQVQIFRPCDVTIWYKTYSVFEYFETLSVV